jgi:hypothetical protein
MMFSTACGSDSITPVLSKWWPFSFIFSRGNRKVGWVGDDSHIIFGQRIPGEKRIVRWCVVLHQPVLLLSKVWDAVTVVFRIDCLVCQDEFFVNNPIDVKENDEHALHFALHPSCLFRPW